MAETKKDEASPLHVVVFPWLAFGHIIPFLELSEQLAKRGHFVTFISAPRNLARLRPVVPEVRPRIRLAPLPLPRVEGLLDGVESTADVPPEKVELLKASSHPSPRSSPRPAPAGAPERGTPGSRTGSSSTSRSTGSRPSLTSTGCRARCSSSSPRPAWRSWAPRRSTTRTRGPRRRTSPSRRRGSLPRCPISRSAATRPSGSPGRGGPTPRASPMQPASGRRRSAARSSCAAAATRSTARSAPSSATSTASPSSPPASSRRTTPPPALPRLPAPTIGTTTTRRPRASCAGSMPSRGGPSSTSRSGARRRWRRSTSARSRSGWSSPACASSGRSGGRSGRRGRSPDGFEARARAAGRGVVRVGWVPQVRVLAHAAVGAFLTHAGWSSLMESFLFGHPLVMLPLFADQGLTARLMAARRVGLEVPWDGPAFGAEDVAATVRWVMVEEEGKVLARNASEMQGVLWDTARQGRYIDELVEHLQQRRRE